MRFVRPVAVLTALVAGASSLGAQQSNSCGGVAAGFADACLKGADILTFMTPQLGNGLAGGNTTPGQGGSLGGFPHFAIAIRATGAPDAKLPDFANIGFRASATPPDNIALKSQAFGLGAVDAALGIFSGINLGVGSILGVDALVSASYVPEVTQGSFSVKPDNPISIGYGARVALFDGTALLPSVGASYLQRSLPKTTLAATASGAPGGTVTLTGLDLKTTSWRVTASQSLLILGLNAGYGQDTYDASTGFSATVTGLGSTGNQSAAAKVTRTNWFVGATFNLLILKLFGEYGNVSGGDLSTYNNFGGGTKTVNDSKNYFSAGVRIGF
ncbi:MAG: hypothetical protein HY275_14685 [Gemmatimonadetes bacterium]|nr:hypothetical protein [Gemmatimonadota bacterium]